ncbi:radical SAM protein [Mycobacterium sp.]|uniref:radical SAM protein n=1 Tax=Mycobacterium sp. TaxID=1785 RepID=UPI002BBEB92B|nr:radical SAM protein [Mycobacterium sp.]HTY34510.1 radical SAM protein [Mycobacterium sp.]
MTDEPSLQSAGRAHVNQAVLKVAQRCNLDCTYCYVYNRGDESWRTRPAFLSERISRQLAARIKAHCQSYGDSSFTVEIHGGEPLLLGRERMQRLIDIIRAGAEPVRIFFTLQTNGTLLDSDWLNFFQRNNISFGVSVDGPPAIADRHRIMRKTGAGSTELVLSNLRYLRSLGKPFDDTFGGCLCVIDPSMNGAELVDWFVSQEIMAFDLLLPDGNVANPPEGWIGVEPYQRFLLEAFDRWYTMPAPAPSIRLFELMMQGLMGAPPQIDGLGGDLRELCVIESDGSIGAHDVLRMCGDRFSRDPINIFDHPLDRHSEIYSIELIQQPCAQCTDCPYFASCGGGYLPHRFDGLDFNNPSLYCEAMYSLSEAMMRALRRDLPLSAWVEDRSAESERTDAHA